MTWFTRRRRHPTKPATVATESGVSLDLALQTVGQVLLDMDTRLANLERQLADVHAAYEGLNAKP